MFVLLLVQFLGEPLGPAPCYANSVCLSACLSAMAVHCAQTAHPLIPLIHFWHRPTYSWTTTTRMQQNERSQTVLYIHVQIDLLSTLKSTQIDETAIFIQQCQCHHMKCKSATVTAIHSQSTLTLPIQ